MKLERRPVNAHEKSIYARTASEAHEVRESVQEAQYLNALMALYQPLDFLLKFTQGKLYTGQYIRQQAENDFGERLSLVREIAREMFNDEYVTNARWQHIGRYFEKCIQADMLPTHIVSEDASGRFASQTLRDFMLLLRKELGMPYKHIPILSYPVGRNSTTEQAKAYASKIASCISKEPKAHVLICSDAIETGNSMRELLRTLATHNRTFDIVITFGVPKDESVLPTIGVPETLNFIAAPHLHIGRGDHIVRPVERIVHDELIDGQLYAPQTATERRRRRVLTRLIVEEMVDAFLSRPAMIKYLNRKNIHREK